MFLRLLSLALVFIMTTQQLSYGSTLLLPYSTEVLEHMANSYNTYTQEQRQQEFRRLKEQLSAADQLFLEQNFPEKEIQWPDVKFHDGEMTFTHAEKTVGFAVYDGKLFIKGKTVQLTGRSLQQVVADVESILGKKAFSVLDLLIPSAYAAVAVVVLAIMAVVLGIIFVGGKLWDFVRKNAYVQLKCLEMSKQLKESNNKQLSNSDAQKIFSDANRIIEQKRIEIQQHCSEAKPAASCGELKKTKECYEEIASNVADLAGPVNNSSRSWVKDLFFGKPRSPASPSAVGR